MLILLIHHCYVLERATAILIKDRGKSHVLTERRCGMITHTIPDSDVCQSIYDEEVNTSGQRSHVRAACPFRLYQI